MRCPWNDIDEGKVVENDEPDCRTRVPVCAKYTGPNQTGRKHLARMPVRAVKSREENLMLYKHNALRSASSWLDRVKSFDHRKVSFVESGQMASTFEGGCGYDQVVSSDHFARRLQIRPQARVSIRGLIGIRNNGQRCHNGLKIFSALGLVRLGPTFYSMPQLRHSDGRNCKPIVRPRRCPGCEVEDAPFPADDDVGIENYLHLSPGSLVVLRAFWRSRRQALASSGDNSVSANTAARSRPEQTFSLSGTKRANGAPFLRRTKVTF
jgi:hypothetical protein